MTGEDYSIVELDWDSAHFGYRVARCAVDTIDPEGVRAVRARMAQRGIRLCYLFAGDHPGQDRRLPSGLGSLVDRKVVYRLDNVVGGTEELSLIIDVSGSRLSPVLRQLAIDSGRFSRFCIDPRFDPAATEALYETWISKSLAGEMADWVLTCNGDDAIPVGFITCLCRQDIGSIGLVAVAAAARGAGVGRRLVDAAVQRCARHGARQVEVVTQEANIPACRLYERCGFTRVQCSEIYHLWVDQPSGSDVPR